MFGFLIGTACLIGLVATLRRGFGGGCGRYGYAAYGGGGGGCGQGHGHGGWHARHHEGPPDGWGGYREREREESEGPPWRGRGGFRGFGPRAWFRRISERLDLTPAQEKAFRQAFEEVRDAGRKAKGEVKETRKDFATAFRADSFDAILLGDVFGKHDRALDDVRKALVGALAKVHESLDEKQREEVARIVEDGWFSRGGW